MLSSAANHTKSFDFNSVMMIHLIDDADYLKGTLKTSKLKFSLGLFTIFGETVYHSE